MNSRIPDGAAAQELRVALASQVRSAGHDEVADFLEAESARPEEVAISPGMPPASPDSIPTSLTPAGPDSSEAANEAEAPDSAGESPAKPLPHAIPPARLAGTRFPQLRCDAMEDVPQFLSMVAWQRQAWPVIVQDVSEGHGSAEVLLTEAPPRVITLRVGEAIPGTSCVIEKLRRRRLYTDAKESTLKNVSEMHFRRTETGETFKALAGVPVLSNDSAALLHISGSDRKWGGMPGDEFRLGSLLLRVTEIAAGVITLENRLSRGTISVALTPPP